MAKTKPQAPAVAPSLVFRRIEDLALYERNARTHSPEQIEQIQASMEEFGWTMPVLEDTAGVVAGHGRIAAAGNIYKVGKVISFPDGTPIPPGHVPVLSCNGWSEQKRRAYILADNQLALNAGWSLALLRGELEWLQAEEFDLEVIGFSQEQLDAIFEPIVPENERDPDAAPPEPEVPHTAPGDVWVLGPHRVTCGDSAAPETWARLLGSELVDCVWTDPPYNVDVAGKNKMLDSRDGLGRSKSGAVANDTMTPDEFREFLAAAYRALFSVMKPGAAIYVAHADLGGVSADFVGQCKQAGFHVQNCIIWRKEQIVLGRFDYQAMHEPILYGWKPGSRHRWFGGRKQSSIQDLGEGSPFQQQEDGTWAIRVGEVVLQVDANAKIIAEAPSSILRHEKPRRAPQHPTMKPVGLVEKQLRFSARSGDLIGDGFGGSGSTLIAADRLGMVARLVELKPSFVDVIVRRWQNYTGRVAVLESGGKPFPVPPNPEEAF